MATSRPIGMSTLSDGDNAAYQYGRSSTALAAHAAAAALRDFARGRTLPSKRSSANSSIVNSSNKSLRSNSNPSELRNHSRPHPEPNPATPTLSSSSSISIDQSPAPDDPLGSGSPEHHESGDPPTSISQKGDSTPTKSSSSPITPLRQSHSRLFRHAQVRRQSSMAASRSQTPMSYCDLGKDYSRYPFLSRPSSFSGQPTSGLQSSGNYGGTGGNSPRLSSSGGDARSVEITQTGYVMNPEKRCSWLLDDRIGAPGTADAGYMFPLYLDEKEIDDDAHMPHPDDDKRMKPKIRELLAPRHLCSLLGLLLMLAGLSCVFILLPVLSYSRIVIYSHPYHAGNAVGNNSKLEPPDHVNDVKYPLLRNVRSGLIDPDTPRSAMTRKSFLGEDLELVFSDEFNIPNRTFYQGDDPFWTAPNIWYGATQDLEWYDSDVPTTKDGTLTIRMDAFQNHGLNYRSGMLHSWNQACFKGGALEISVSLPGVGGSSGLWPGAWTMGNLGKPGHKASTDGVWPYTYNSCDVGITPNQSMTDGTSYLKGQKLPSCVCPGEDHPTPGTGRGAPEIDVFEASADPNLKLGVITQSYQVAPYDIWYHADYDFLAFPNYDTARLNSYCGGPYQQAISGKAELNNKWYEGKQYQKYGFEYIPGTGSDGQIAWFVGDDMSYVMNGNAIGPNGNVDSRPISEEPMSIVLNVGISPAWTGIIYEELDFPATMYVDYVRWYQPAGKTSVTCDPPGYETTEYIKKHPKAYDNINLTSWDETGYGWPKHKLNTNC